MPTSADPLRDATIPAWPVLVAIQATLLVSFVTVGFVRAPPRPLRDAPPLDQRLQALDLPAAEAAVASALAAARSPAALPSGELAPVSAVLVDLAGRAGADSATVTWGEPTVQAGVELQPATLDLRIDPFDLPVLLALLERWPVGVRPTGVEAVGAGGRAATLRLELLLTRPHFVDTDWVGSRLQLAASGADAATPVLQDAALLSAWRVYTSDQATRAPAAAAATREAHWALSPLLVRLRSEGGRLWWTPGQPAVLD